jgi:hypothetical protein
MLVPHLKFIESLIIAKKPLDEITDELKKYGLKTPDKVLAVMLDTIRNDNPEYFHPVNPESADPEWIRSLDIQEMFCHLTNFSFPENLPSPRRAFQLIDDPLMYRLVTSLALAKITDEDIELIVNGKFNMEYEVEDVKMFLKYFFKVDEWTLRDRQKYVEKITDPNLSKYYKMALKGDKDYLLWKLGAAPEKDFGHMLRDMIHDSYYNFKEQSKVKPGVAQKWATLAIKLTDRIDNLEKADKDAGNKFLDNFEFKIKSDIHISSKDGDGKAEVVHLKDLQPDEFDKNKNSKGGENVED